MPGTRTRSPIAVDRGTHDTCRRRETTRGTLDRSVGSRCHRSVELSKSRAKRYCTQAEMQDICSLAWGMVSDTTSPPLPASLGTRGAARRHPPGGPHRRGRHRPRRADRRPGAAQVLDLRLPGRPRRRPRPLRPGPRSRSREGRRRPAACWLEACSPRPRPRGRRPDRAGPPGVTPPRAGPPRLRPRPRHRPAPHPRGTARRTSQRVPRHAHRPRDRLPDPRGPRTHRRGRLRRPRPASTASAPAAWSASSAAAPPPSTPPPSPAAPAAPRPSATSACAPPPTP